MPLKVAFQMDPLESINIDTDSSFMMALEAERRGHQLFHYLPRHLSLDGNRLSATIKPFSVRRERGNHFTAGAAERVDLSEFDLVLMRQDPPFDMAYITATHLLEHIQPKTLVLNDPASVRNAPEKLFVTHFPKLMPPTLITSDKEAILAFRAEHKDIIVKPLFGNGGAGVFHLKPDDENLAALLETFTLLYREPVIVQRYLPEIRQGDKRVILIDGKAAGGVSRVPQAGEARANFHAGGSARKTTLTKREQEICEAIGPTLREQGLVFVGIDVIGDWLTEINVTSPTGIQEINRLDNVQLERTLWDAIEARLG
ncbi:MAG TPA: glutathione synthase [Alphaproteobacteria bacterium]|nr:glutathione synthase [Alphaproteobacteria bacterium]